MVNKQRFIFNTEVLDAKLAALVEGFNEREEEIYRPHQIFPEFVFNDAIAHIQDDRARRQMIFLATLYDTRKRSDVHLRRDMLQVAKTIHPNEIKIPRHRFETGLDKKLAQLEHLGINPGEDTILYIANNHAKKISSSQELDLFATPEYTVGEYFSRHFMSSTQKVDQMIQGICDLAQKFDADPINAFSLPYTQENIQDGYEALQSIKRIGPHLSWLMTTYLCYHGDLKTNAQDLNLPPKVDKNDMALLIAMDCLQITEEIPNTEEVADACSKAIYESSRRIGESAFSIDLALWAASRVHSETNLPWSASPVYGLTTPKRIDDALFQINRYITGRLFTSPQAREQSEGISRNNTGAGQLNFEYSTVDQKPVDVYP